HQEAAESPALGVGQDVAVLEVEPLAQAGVGERREREVLAVADGPEERQLRVETPARGLAELRKEEPRLALAPDGGREERHERDERDVPHPERRVGPVEELVEVRGAGAEVEGPVGRVAVARREDALLHAVDAFAKPFHLLAREAVVGGAAGLPLGHDGPLRHPRVSARRGGQGQPESNRGTSAWAEQSRSQVSQKSSSDKGVYAISRLFGRARFIARRHAQHVAQERQLTGDTKDGGPRLPRGEG